MILIIAEKDDIPSLRLIHLLTKNNIKYYFLCIDEEDPLIHINIETNDIFINDVDYREYKAIWFRRFNFQSYLFLCNEICTEVAEYLSYEKKRLFEFVLQNLYEKCPIKIGNPKYENINKLLVLQKAKSYNLKVPPTIVSNFKSNICFKDYISKPIGEVFFRRIGNTVFQTFTEKVDPLDLSNSFFYSLFQQNLQKKLECKSIYFNGMFYTIGFKSLVDNIIDYRNYNHNKEMKIFPMELPNDIKSRLIQLFHSFNLNFGVVDMVIDNNNDYILLEINPEGQFDDIVEYGNFPIYEKIYNYLIQQNG